MEILLFITYWLDEKEINPLIMWFNSDNSINVLEHPVYQELACKFIPGDTMNY